jgi:mRNA guanylyltransferase
MKASGQQFDDVVVEVSWDLKGGPLSADGEATPGWRLHRVRDDKHDGNHHTIVQKIITSIEDGVEEDEVSTSAGGSVIASADWSAVLQLVGAEQEMRRAWKSEERTRIRKAGLVQSRTEAPSRPEAPAGRRMGPGPPMRGVPPPGLKR